MRGTTGGCADVHGCGVGDGSRSQPPLGRAVFAAAGQGTRGHDSRGSAVGANDDNAGAEGWRWSKALTTAG